MAWMNRALLTSLDDLVRPHAYRLRDRQPECPGDLRVRSEEHTSELQSREKHVCRLLREKKISVPMLLKGLFAEVLVGILLDETMPVRLGEPLQRSKGNFFF